MGASLHYVPWVLQVTVLGFFMTSSAGIDASCDADWVSWLQLELNTGALDRAASHVDAAGNRAEELPDHERPRVLLGFGCAGSTWTLQFISELMEAHGYNVDNAGEYLQHLELDNPDLLGQNRPESLLDPDFLESAHEKQQEERPAISISQNTTAVVEALWKRQREAVSQGKTLVLKLPNPTMGDRSAKLDLRQHPALMEALGEMGAYMITTYRANALDRLVCLVEDCMPLYGVAGYAINTSTGNPDFQCFNRRDKDRSDYKVQLLTSELVEQLRALTVEAETYFSVIADDPLYPDVPQFTYENVTKFEENANNLSHGVEIWSQLLTAWSVPVDRDIVRAVLGPLAGSRPLEPHAADIYNIEQVVKTLEPHPELSKFLRL